MNPSTVCCPSHSRVHLVRDGRTFRRQEWQAWNFLASFPIEVIFPRYFISAQYDETGGYIQGKSLIGDDKSCGRIRAALC
jgi:hypothetical protein